MSLLIKNIGGLVQVEEFPRLSVSGIEMSELNVIYSAYLYIKDRYILDFGPMSELNESKLLAEEKGHVDVISAPGKFIFPSFCDSHTHIVHAGSREKEFVYRLKGLSYEEISRRGGGILNSASVLHDTSEDDLYQQSLERINEIIETGTGAVEIKSGYGLNLDDELKMLRVIKRLKDTTPLEIKATFMGAHAVPEEYRHEREKYVDLIISEMIPIVASEELADFIDVFCDRGFFSVEDTERILMAGIKYGLIPKLHANELDYSGGVEVGVRYNALSVDHLEFTGEKEIESLKGSETMPTLLPGPVFFLGLPLPPARRMIDAGLPVALASDFNPGSCPSGNMKLVMSMGCIMLKMLPEEAINAVTINSAYAMGLSETHGSIARGKTANLFITSEMPSYEYFPYSFGSSLIETVILNGKIIRTNNPVKQL